MTSLRLSLLTVILVVSGCQSDCFGPCHRSLGDYVYDPWTSGHGHGVFSVDPNVLREVFEAVRQKSGDVGPVSPVLPVRPYGEWVNVDRDTEQAIVDAAYAVWGSKTVTIRTDGGVSALIDRPDAHRYVLYVIVCTVRVYNGDDEEHIDAELWDRVTSRFVAAAGRRTWPRTPR